MPGKRHGAGAHDPLQDGARIVVGLGGLAVVGEHLVEKPLQDLVPDRLLGIEVVVEAAREDAGGVGDLAHGRRAEPLFGEELAGQRHEVGPAFRWCGHGNIMRVPPCGGWVKVKANSCRRF
jgi:hypothetical protein